MQFVSSVSRGKISYFFFFFALSLAAVRLNYVVVKIMEVHRRLRTRAHEKEVVIL